MARVLCGPGSMWPGFYVARVLCGLDSMWPGFYVAWVLCGPGSMWPGFYVARVLCGPDVEFILQLVFSIPSIGDTGFTLTAAY